MKMDLYFKLFHSIKQPDEIELARLEIESLTGVNRFEEIHSVVDLLRRTEFGAFVDTQPHSLPATKDTHFTFQRYLEYQTAYRVQGFLLRNADIASLNHLVRRLAYTREIYCLVYRKSVEKTCRQLLKRGVYGANIIAFQSNERVVIRAVVDQYYLEATEYISKISPGLKDRGKLDTFIEKMKYNLVTGLNRIPASTKARVGKRFLDYLSDRQEASLYLFHGLHPYKGKFHPKMARALLNIAYSHDTGLIMDNFAGSGTLLIEAAFLGFDSVGIDVNPQSVLVAKARLHCIHLDLAKLDSAKSKLQRIFESELKRRYSLSSDQEALDERSFFPSRSDLKRIKNISSKTYNYFTQNKSLEDILTLRNIIQSKFRNPIREVLMLGLAMVISAGRHAKKLDAGAEMQLCLENIYRRVYIFAAIKDFLKLTVGRGKVYRANTRNLQNLGLNGKIDAIVNSPPYSTAIDYINNDIHQLVLLGYLKSKDERDALEQEMGGNPRFIGDKDFTMTEIKHNTCGLPLYAIDIIRILLDSCRKKQALRLYSFYTLMTDALTQEMICLKPGRRSITVIGNNLLKLAKPPEKEGGELLFRSRRRPFREIPRDNNVKSIDMIVVDENDIDAVYGDEVPISISTLSNQQRTAHNGIYIDVENDRAILLIAQDIGFIVRMIIFRYLEKTRRGDIRLETIIIKEKIQKK